MREVIHRLGRDSKLVEPCVDYRFNGNDGFGLQLFGVSFRDAVLCPRLEALTLTEHQPLSIL